MIAGRGARAGVMREDEGQMVVEMAVIVPVMLVIALVVLNLMWFLEASARFDRVVPDAILATAVSPSGETSGFHEHDVAAALEQAMGGLRGVTVSVRAESAWDAALAGTGFSVAPYLVRYVCTMAYTPWPAGFSVAGVEAGVPAVLRHERSFVIDRYRPGVLF